MDFKNDWKALEEQRVQLEKALKSARTNEKFISSEMDHLRNTMEDLQNNKNVEKDKEINALKEKLNEVVASLLGNIVQGVFAFFWYLGKCQLISALKIALLCVITYFNEEMISNLMKI